MIVRARGQCSCDRGSHHENEQAHHTARLLSQRGKYQRRGIHFHSTSLKSLQSICKYCAVLLCKKKTESDPTCLTRLTLASICRFQKSILVAASYQSMKAMHTTCWLPLLSFVFIPILKRTNATSVEDHQSSKTCLETDEGEYCGWMNWHQWGPDDEPYVERQDEIDVAGIGDYDFTEVEAAASPCDDRSKGNQRKIDDAEYDQMDGLRDPLGFESADDVREKVLPYREKLKRQNRLRGVLMLEWERRGLDFDMDPQELALAVTKIKIEKGHDKSLGAIAGSLVRGNASQDYYQKFQILLKNYGNRLLRIRKAVKEDVKIDTDEERIKVLLIKIAEYKTKQYGQPRKHTHSTSMADDMQVDQRAKAVWDYFVTVLPEYHKNRAISDPKNLNVAIIEKYSRDLQVGKLDAITCAGYLKRYMGRVLKKSDDEILRFATLRHRARVIQYNERNRIKEDEKRMQVGLPPRMRRKDNTRGNEQC